MKNFKEDLRSYLVKYENRFPKIYGISNISRSDIEDAIMYHDFIIAGRGYELIKPTGNVKLLLEKGGII